MSAAAIFASVVRGHLCFLRGEPVTDLGDDVVAIGAYRRAAARVVTS